jgi:monoamine oxidase
LDRRLQRLSSYVEAAVSAKHGGENQVKNGANISRRQLLRGIGAIGGTGAAYSAMQAMNLLGGGMAMARGYDTTAPLPASSLQGSRVIVIGAGLAGLCSALRLARAGAEVEILEATGHVGGRSLTLRHGDSFSEWDWESPTKMLFEQVGDVKPENPGNYLNAGPGRIPQHHERVLDYCRDLGVELQPYIYYDAANLAQNDDWNGGRPVQLRRLKNDLRGHIAEMLAKVQNQGALDQLVDPSEVDTFLGMLQRFGQLSAEGAELFYRGSATVSNYPRSGYRISPGAAHQPGRPWPTLTMEEVLTSDFWQSEMFHDLEYFWQATLMQPVDGMDTIIKGFQRAEVPGGRAVSDLIMTNQPVRSIDVDGDQVLVNTSTGARPRADYVIASMAPPLLSRLGGNFLNPVVKQVLASVVMSPACKVGWQGRYRFWEEEDQIFGGISWTKDIVNQIWYPSYGFNSATGVLTGAYSSSAGAAEFQQLSREQRLQAALRGGEKLHPGFGDKVFAENGVSIAWAKMPYQAGGWANETSFTQPDVFDQMANTDPINRRIFMAGDWFSFWPGWQIGALDSAHLATDKIARLAAGRG